MAGAKVAVIGGGLAGLCAASELSARGFEVALFEREPSPGGRAGSEREKDFGFEPGAHAIASSDRRLLALVARAGLAGELLPLHLARLGPADYYTFMESLGLSRVRSRDGLDVFLAPG